MPATPRQVGREGGLPPFITALLQSIQGLQDRVRALEVGTQQTNIIDQYGNTIVIAGQLNQTVTIGAAYQQPGVQVGTTLPATGQPNAGLAVQQNLATGTITTTAGSTTATLNSTASGTFTNGQVIGAANVTDPSSGVATPAITPGTTFTISGSTVTLSQAAAESGSAIYCAACNWYSLQTFTHP